jgi:transposase
VPGERVPDDAGGLRAVNARLRAVVEAKDAEIAVLRAEREADREALRLIGLQVAELQRRLGMDSSNSGTPTSKEGIAAGEERRARQRSERERSKDRKRGGQPGHPGKGLARDPDPGEREDAPPPAECRKCRAGLDGAAPAGRRWAQSWDVRITRVVTEWLLPGLECPCCGEVTFAAPPPGLHAGSVSYGPGLNAAAVLLTAYGNVPPERAAQVIGMLLGAPVSAGWVDKASARLSALLGKAGLDEAMLAALAGQGVLAADETPVSVLVKGTAPQPAGQDKEEQAGPEDKDKAPAGAPHVLIVRTPDGLLTWLTAIASRRKAEVGGGIPAAFTGTLITDGYTGYQHLLPRLAGIQQCCQHVIRRCRAVAGLGPGSLQSWAEDIIATLRDAHRAAEEARARSDTALDQQVLDDVRERYDKAVARAIIHNRLRDWHDGNHPGYSLGTWLRDYKEQVLLFTRDLAVDWTSNVAERGAKAAKRHQAVSGYWHTLATLARWCRIRSYLDSAMAHGVTAIEAIRTALQGTPWLPPIPGAA